MNPLVIFVAIPIVTKYAPNSHEIVSHKGKMKYIPIYITTQEFEQNK
jgi:hypothetical protein